MECHTEPSPRSSSDGGSDSRSKAETATHDLEFRSRQKAASFWCSDAQPSRTKPKSSRHLGRSVYKRSATADATETQNRGDLQRQADVCKSVLRAAARI